MSNSAFQPAGGISTNTQGGSTSGPFLHASAREKFVRFNLAFASFLGGFVINEPAPYELYLLLLIVMFMLFGMRLGRLALALTALFGLFNFGGLLSMFTLKDYEGIPLYLAVSLFLGLTSVFWCAAIAADMTRLRTIFRGYTLGAMVTGCLGILGYFNAFPGASVFTRYDRAMGAFQDPNVFGPFLVLPIMYLLYGVLARSAKLAPFRAAGLFILLFAVFLSFSRAAWGLTVASGGIVYVLALATEPSPAKRVKLIVIGALGLASVVLALIIALQFDAVSEMFSVRAKVVQEYDGAEVGRFARHFIGFKWALTNPLGIGPLEFGQRLGEDTHNIWVKALMAYGWLGFFSFLIITVITLVGGAKMLGRPRPWQPYVFCAYSVFVGHMLISWVIDIDHWRHVYLIIGILWGCMALEAKHQRKLVD